MPACLHADVASARAFARKAPGGGAARPWTSFLPVTMTLTSVRVEEREMNRRNELIRVGRIEGRVLRLRGHNVLLDSDLAVLYDVPARVLNQAVKRNRERFPADFMFRLTRHEVDVLRSQSVTSRSGHGGRRHAPYAFTEQGVAMLSS